MVVHAAFGGSTNLLLHIPAIAFAAGLRRPTVDDWHEINLKVPRLVSVLPNGPFYHPTVRAYLAGGVPEVMLHLRELDLLDLVGHDRFGRAARTCARVVGEERAPKALRERLFEQDAVDPDDVIMSPGRAREHGLTSTVTFPRGNLAPAGSVIKSTAIDPSVVDPDGVYRKTGPARVFTREHEAIAAIKGQGEKPIRPGDVLVLIGRGPAGAGMEEIYQITAALRYLSFGKHVAVLTDARFSGVSTGACIGHISPEALAGGPIGKLRDGDSIRIVVDRVKLEGSLDLDRRRGRCSRPDGSVSLARATVGASDAFAGPGTCRMTPGSGRRFRMSAAERGADVSMIPTRSSLRFKRERRDKPRCRTTGGTVRSLRIVRFLPAQGAWKELGDQVFVIGPKLLDVGRFVSLGVKVVRIERADPFHAAPIGVVHQMPVGTFAVDRHRTSDSGSSPGPLREGNP